MDTKKNAYYILREYAGNATLWSADEAAELRNAAHHMLSSHGSHGNSVDDRISCGACMLSGYQAPGDLNIILHGPNHSGWLRIYVQAGVKIRRWRKAIINELKTNDNAAYMDALKRDIVTFLK